MKLYSNTDVKCCNLLIIIFILLCVNACQNNIHDSKLENIWNYVSESPREAINALDSIDSGSLSKSDKMFYELLCIKAKDKAYIIHKSDSAILSVIDYYSKSKDRDLYTESLYYGGRVYYDLGDYPTALRYFQNALDRLPKESKDQMLRGNVLSQMSAALDDLGLYTQAIEYEQELIKINEAMKDTLNLSHNYKMLASFQLRKTDYSDALENAKIADKFALHLDDVDMAEMKILQASIYYRMDSIGKALALIRPWMARVDSLAEDVALCYASQIYLDANVLDTAYLYARKLTERQDYHNKKAGYTVLLSPKLRQFLSNDSIDFLYSQYKTTLEQHFRKQESTNALIQNSMYNYNLHDRLKQNALQSKEYAWKIIFILFILILLLVTILLYIGFRHKKRLLELHEALAKITIIEKSLTRENKLDYKIDKANNVETGKDVIIKNNVIASIDVNKEKELKFRLRNKLMSIKDLPIPFDISPTILKSPIYNDILSLIKNKQPITKSNFWDRLENIIIECYPDFKTRLQLLSDGCLNEDDFRLSMLIRCGFSPKELAILLCKSNGAITYRRKKMSKRLFGEELKPELLDDIIRRM